MFKIFINNFSEKSPFVRLVGGATMSLSRKDLEELRPMLDRTVHKFLGFTEPTLATAALNCIDKGYEKRKTIGT